MKKNIFIIGTLLIVLITISGCFFNVPNKVKDPIFSPAAGTYQNSVQVTLSSQTTSAQIHYTLDGSTPNESSPLYTVPITITSSRTVKARAYLGTFLSSNVMSATYTINVVQPIAVAPTITPATGTYTSAQQVTMSSSTPGAQIRYTADGTEPTASSTLYSAAIPLSATTTIRAKTFATGYTASTTTTGVYTINITPPAPVSRSFYSNPVNAGQTVQVTLSFTQISGSVFLEETIPAGFVMSLPLPTPPSQNSSHVTYSSSTRIIRLAWQPPGTYTYNYTLTAPSTGSYTFYGEYFQAGGSPIEIGGTKILTVQ
jgi:hypothetical protein